jgi:hypothetical protein
MNNYYTYAFLREDGTPYYIGKGTANRIYDNRRLVRFPKDLSRRIFLKKNLTEEEAFKHEIYMIAVFGRKDLGTGILHNKTNGGEGMSGHRHSNETKEKMRQRGLNRSEEYKIKMSNSLKGRKLSPESIEKMKKSLRGRKHNEDVKQRIKDSCSQYEWGILNTQTNQTEYTNSLRNYCKENNISSHQRLSKTYQTNKTCKGFIVISKKSILKQ